MLSVYCVCHKMLICDQHLIVTISECNVSQDSYTFVNWYTRIMKLSKIWGEFLVCHIVFISFLFLIQYML